MDKNHWLVYRIMDGEMLKNRKIKLQIINFIYLKVEENSKDHLVNNMD
jgi:hypothetical protein